MRHQERASTCFVCHLSSAKRLRMALLARHDSDNVGRHAVVLVRVPSFRNIFSEHLLVTFVSSRYLLALRSPMWMECSKALPRRGFSSTCSIASKLVSSTCPTGCSDQRSPCTFWGVTDTAWTGGRRTRSGMSSHGQGASSQDTTSSVRPALVSEHASFRSSHLLHPEYWEAFRGATPLKETTLRPSQPWLEGEPNESLRLNAVQALWHCLYRPRISISVYRPTVCSPLLPSS